MQITAKLKYLRMSPRKVRLVANVVRKMEVNSALDQLKFINKKAAKPIEKLINSGIANAEHNYELNKNNLYIKEIRVDESTTLKRWIPRAFGRATPIRKRSSHIFLTLGELKDSNTVKFKKQTIEAPIKLGTENIELKSDHETVNVKKDKESFKETTAATRKKIIDPRMRGKGKHTKIEGNSHKSFINKMFRRKTG